MKDRYMLSVAVRNEPVNIYSYGETFEDACAGLALADFLPAPNPPGRLTGFFQFCITGINSSPGCHAFYSNMGAVYPDGKETLLYAFLLHVMEPPEEIPAFRLMKSTIFAFDFDGKKAGEIEPSHAMYELELITRPTYCRSEINVGTMEFSDRDSLSESLFGMSYNRETTGIGILGFAPAGLGRTTGACYISAELFNSGIPVRNMYMGKLPNINPENSGLRIDNPPKGFSL